MAGDSQLPLVLPVVITDRDAERILNVLCAAET
jgi:hypothetical protein